MILTFTPRARQIDDVNDAHNRLVICRRQTARIWDVTTGETKLELRGHEHRLEAAIFAPANATTSIRELAGLVSHACLPRPLLVYPACPCQG